MSVVAPDAFVGQEVRSLAASTARACVQAGVDSVHAFCSWYLRGGCVPAASGSAAASLESVRVTLGLNDTDPNRLMSTFRKTTCVVCVDGSELLDMDQFLRLLEDLWNEGIDGA